MNNLKRRSGLGNDNFQRALDNVDMITLNRLGNLDPRRLVAINKKLYNSHALVNMIQRKHTSGKQASVIHTRRPYTANQIAEISRRARATGHRRPQIHSISVTGALPMRPDRYRERMREIRRAYTSFRRAIAALPISTNRSSKMSPRVRRLVVSIHRLLGPYVDLKPPVFGIVLPLIIESSVEERLRDICDMTELIQYMTPSNTANNFTLPPMPRDVIEGIEWMIQRAIKMIPSWSNAMSQYITESRVYQPRVLKFALRQGLRPNKHPEIFVHLVEQYVTSTVHARYKTYRKLYLQGLGLLMRNGFDLTKQFGKGTEFKKSTINTAASHLVLSMVGGVEDEIMYSPVKNKPIKEGIRTILMSKDFQDLIAVLRKNNTKRRPKKPPGIRPIATGISLTEYLIRAIDLMPSNGTMERFANEILFGPRTPTYLPKTVKHINYAFTYLL
jgi:hypothetical protein